MNYEELQAKYEHVVQHSRMLLNFINADGSPVDGFRFREIAIELRKLVCADDIKKKHMAIIEQLQDSLSDNEIQQLMVDVRKEKEKRKTDIWLSADDHAIFIGTTLHHYDQHNNTPVIFKVRSISCDGTLNGDILGMKVFKNYCTVPKECYFKERNFIAEMKSRGIKINEMSSPALPPKWSEQ